MQNEISGVVLAILPEATGAEACLVSAYVASAALGRPAVSALHVRIDPASTILPTEEMLTEKRRRAIELSEQREQQAIRKTYDAVSERFGTDAFEWHDVLGKEAEEVEKIGSAAGLLVMAVPPQRASGYVREALHAALFKTHRPLLMIPPSCHAHQLRRIVVGWHDDESCRRAVMAARPWLEKAEKVRVIHVDESGPDDFSGAKRLLGALEERSSFETVSKAGLSNGQRLLYEARGADWLVVGAYHHMPVIEWLLGGVSRSILGHASLPVFSMH